MGGLEGVSEYLSGPWLVVLLTLFGLAVGVLIGLFGVGGGFLVTPLLQLMFGIPYTIAVGSSLCFTIGSGASGLARHVRAGNYEPRTIAFMAVGAMAGALGGAQFNLHLNAAFGKVTYTLIMHSLFVVMLLATAVLLLARPRGEGQRRSPLQRLPLPPRVDLADPGPNGVSVPGLFVTGGAIGFLAGLMGIGGGIFMMPILVLIVGLSPHQAVGTSLGVMIWSGIMGTVKYTLNGRVNLWVAMALLVGSTVGIQVGAAICTRIHGYRLTKWFSLLVLAVVAFLIFDFVRQIQAL